MRRLAAFAIIALTGLSACGGDSAPKAATDADIDVAAIRTTLWKWALFTVKEKYPDITSPYWEGGDDQFVLAVLPLYADPVAYCQEVNDVLTETAGAGFDRVDIHVVAGGGYTVPLAVSKAGANCREGAG